MYVAVGDSYPAGYRPAADGGPGRTTRAGYPFQVVSLARSRGYDLTLANFACSGATTSSVLREAGCDARLRAPGSDPYTGTQADAAVAYVRAHRDDVRLISVSLGGNDIRPCIDAATIAQATSCVSRQLTTITGNLRTLVGRLRSAAGPAVRIVGTGYPDVFLGESLSDSAERRQLAELSAVAFQTVVDPQLTQAYASAGASFADVATATGAYLPVSRTAVVAPYGRIPLRVARVCQLTYYCSRGDIHPTPAGHRIIAGLVVRALPVR